MLNRTYPNCTIRFTAMLMFGLLISFSSFAQVSSDTCTMPAYPEIKFAPASITLSQAAKNSLTAIAKKLKTSPGCNLSVIAHGYKTVKAQQLGWDRIMNVMEYLYAQGIPEERLLFSNGYEGNPNTVELVATMEDGPHLVPPPYPPASKRKKTK